MQRRELALRQARVADAGFPLRTTGAQRLPHYDYARRSPFWDTRHMKGFYTEFGPAEALVERVDGAVAIIGPGEELHLEFEAPKNAPQRAGVAPSSWRATAGPRTWISIPGTGIPLHPCR
ncbi:MAG: hypothetical protein ABFS45_10385 [Pseudomonadota bacterium]